MRSEPSGEGACDSGFSRGFSSACVWAKPGDWRAQVGTAPTGPFARNYLNLRRRTPEQRRREARGSRCKEAGADKCPRGNCHDERERSCNKQSGLRVGLRRLGRSNCLRELPRGVGRPQLGGADLRGGAAGRAVPGDFGLKREDGCKQAQNGPDDGKPRAPVVKPARHVLQV